MNKRKKKIAGWSFLTVLILSGVFTLALKIWFPAEKIKQIVEERLSTETGRECNISQAGISIWRGFSIVLTDLEIAALPGESSNRLLFTERLFLKVKLLPLLKRRVEIVSFTLDRPELWLEVDKGGRLGAADVFAQAPEKEDEAVPAAREGTSFELLILSARIEKALIHYLDRRDTLEMTIGPLDAELSMNRVRGDNRTEIKSRIDVDKLSVSNSETFSDLSAELFPLRLDLLATLQSEGEHISFGTIDFSQIELDLAGIEIGGKGNLHEFGSKSFSYQFGLQGGTDNLTRLLSLIPMRDDNDSWIKEINGTLSLETSISGSAAEKDGPEYSVTVGLKNISAQFKDITRPVSGLNATLVLDKKALVLKNLNASFGEDPLSMDGKLSLGTKNYPFSLNVKSSLRIDDLPRGISGISDWQAHGKVDSNLRFYGQMSRLIDVMADGKLFGSDIEITAPGETGTIKIPRVEIIAAGPDLKKISLELSMKSSQLNIEAEINQYHALLFQGKYNPLNSNWTLKVRGGSLNLTDFIETGDRDSAKTVDQDSPLKDFRMPFSLGRGSGTIQVNSLTLKAGIELKDVELAFNALDRTVSVYHLKSRLFSGDMNGTGEIQLPREGLPGYLLDLKADKVNAGELLSPFSKLGNYLSGKVSTDMHLERESGSGDLLTDGLLGNADFTLDQGTLADWPALNSLSGLTGIDELKRMQIDNWVGRLKIADGKVRGEDLRINTSVSDMLVSGTMGFDGGLDYSLDLLLNKNLTEKYRSRLPGEITSLLTGNEDRIELNLNIGGTTVDPKVSWNTKPVVRRLEKKIGGQLNKLVDRLIPGMNNNNKDSSDTVTDSTSSTQPAQQLPGLLKNLLKRKEPDK